MAGGIIGALPGQIGIASFSPRLDSHGTSVRGVAELAGVSVGTLRHYHRVGVLPEPEVLRLIGETT